MVTGRPYPYAHRMLCPTAAYGSGGHVATAGAGVSALAFSPDDERFVSASNDHPVKIRRAGGS
jgi:hypothetical protein